MLGNVGELIKNENQKIKKETHDYIRKKLWMDAVIAKLSVSPTDIAIQSADLILKNFDERFDDD